MVSVVSEKVSTGLMLPDDIMKSGSMFSKIMEKPYSQSVFDYKSDLKGTEENKYEDIKNDIPDEEISGKEEKGFLTKISEFFGDFLEKAKNYVKKTVGGFLEKPVNFLCNSIGAGKHKKNESKWDPRNWLGLRYENGSDYVNNTIEKTRETFAKAQEKLQQDKIQEARNLMISGITNIVEDIENLEKYHEASANVLSNVLTGMLVGGSIALGTVSGGSIPLAIALCAAQGGVFKTTLKAANDRVAGRGYDTLTHDFFTGAAVGGITYAGPVTSGKFYNYCQNHFGNIAKNQSFRKFFGYAPVRDKFVVAPSNAAAQKSLSSLKAAGGRIFGNEMDNFVLMLDSMS